MFNNKGPVSLNLYSTCCFKEFHCYISLTLTTILEKEGEFSQFGTSAASEGRLAMQLKDHHNQQHLLPTLSYQDHLLPTQVLQGYEPFDMVVSFPSLSSTVVVQVL